MLKSHLLFDICSKSLLTSNKFQQNDVAKNNFFQMPIVKCESSSSPISNSSSSTSSSANTFSNTFIGLKTSSTKSAFTPIKSPIKIDIKLTSNTPSKINNKRASTSMACDSPLNGINGNSFCKNFNIEEKFSKKLKTSHMLSPNQNKHNISYSSTSSHTSDVMLNQNFIKSDRASLINHQNNAVQQLQSPCNLMDLSVNSSIKNNEKIKHVNERTHDVNNITNSGLKPDIIQNDAIKMDFFKNRQSLFNKSLDWKITLLDGTQTVELNVADELGKPKKTHVCLFCGKIYNRKYGLKIHLRTHTGYKPLKCKVCSRPFSDPSNLNKHVRLHSQGETAYGNTSPYRCPYCGKILVRKRDLDRHIISRHTNNSNYDNNENNNESSDHLDNHESGECEDDDEENEIDVDGIADDEEEKNFNSFSSNDCNRTTTIKTTDFNECIASLIKYESNEKIMENQSMNDSN